MILDIVIRSARKVFGDVRPSVPILLVHGDQNRLFVICPFSLFQFRVQMIDKSFSTLFSLPPWQVCSNFGPLSAVQESLFAKNRVLFRSPGSLSLDDGRIGERLPLGEALNWGVINKVSGDLVPSWSSVFVRFYQSLEQIDFILAPIPSSIIIRRSNFGVGGLCRSFVIHVFVLRLRSQ